MRCPAGQSCACMPTFEWLESAFPFRNQQVEKRNPFHTQPEHIHNPSDLWRLDLAGTELKYLGEPSNTEHREESSRQPSAIGMTSRTGEWMMAVQPRTHTWPIQHTALWQQHANSCLKSELRPSCMKDLVPVFSQVKKIHFFPKSRKGNWSKSCRQLQAETSSVDIYCLL